MFTPQLTDYDGPRTPQPDEWDAVREMSRAVFFKDSASYLEAARRWPMALCQDVREHAFAMFHRGEPVSVIARLERDFVCRGCRLRMGFIGGVCTHADHRGKGLAGATLAACMEEFGRRDVDFVFISGRRPLYLRAGAERVGGRTQFVLTADNTAALADASVELRVATRDDAALVAELNQRQALRFVRPLEDYALTLEHGHCSGRAAAVHVASRDRAPAAYVIATPPADNDGVVTSMVLESAGESGAVLAALARLAKSLGPQGRLVAAMASESALAAQLAARRASGAPSATGCTVKVVDFARTMSKLGPSLAERLPADFVSSLRWTQGYGRYVGWSGKEMLVIDGERDMLWTLLGPPPGEPQPKVRATGRMAELIEACFPIPLPNVELNKI